MVTGKRKRENGKRRRRRMELSLFKRWQEGANYNSMFILLLSQQGHYVCVCIQMSMIG